MYKKILIVMVVLGFLLGLVGGAVSANEPSQKPGTKVQIPIVNVEDGWKTWIQTLNTSVATDTGVVVFFWGDYSERCPSNDPGPIGHACQMVSAEGTWTLISGIPDGARSAILYSVDKDHFNTACNAAGETTGNSKKWVNWVETHSGTGEALMTTVWRRGPNDFGTFGASTYNGITEALEGEGPPYGYFSPYAMKGYFGLDTEMMIQNSGLNCTSVWLYYMEQTANNDCFWDFADHIENLAPGESIRKRVPDYFAAPFLGSVYITANEPLGIIVDQTGFGETSMHDRGVLLTSRVEPFPSYGDTRLYADLIFREWSGWSASIQVQNMGRTGQPAFVTVEFLDASGGQILFLGDWVCRHGSGTFYLPVVTNLGTNMVGRAVIESHSQVAYPGDVVGEQPIVAWVDLKRAPDQGSAPQGASYVPHAEHQKLGWETMVFPWVAKEYPIGDQAVTTLLAVANNSNCVKTEVQLKFTDETGITVCQISDHWLQAEHMWLVDLANIGCLIPGWTGAVVLEVTAVEQLCDVDGDGHIDQQPVMISGMVFTRGPGSWASGDITTAAEAWGVRTELECEPTPTPTNTPTSTPTPTATPTPTSTPTATPTVDC